MAARPLVVFEASLSKLSSTGSCMMEMLQPLLGTWPVHLFTSDCQLRDAPGSTRTTILLPKRPAFLRMLLFSLFSACAYTFTRVPRGLSLSNDGQFPFCDIYYRHFNPRFFLLHRREAIAASSLRRVSRTFNYCWYALLEFIALRRARKIVVPSNGMARELASTYSGIVNGKIQVIPNPVDTKHFRRENGFNSSALYQRLLIPPNAFVLSFCALASFTAKGLHIVLEALAAIADLAIHLIVIGGHSGEIREFEEIAKRLDVAENVHFVGLQNDIRPYLWSSHVYVFPSAYESFSLVCLQAAAAGLPLIATRVYGVEDLLVDGMNGWIIERNAESVAAAIRDASASLDNTSRMGRNAQESACAYDTEIFRSRWLNLLDKEFGIHVIKEMEIAAN